MTRYIDTKPSDGTSFGQDANDPISFYNATPTVQPSGNVQAAITRGAAAGLIATFATLKSPASVTVLSTSEQSFTLVGGTGASVTIATTDLLVVSKPTMQATLGIGNIRASSAGVAGITFHNVSTVDWVTPTASQVYGVVALRGLNSVTTAITAASVAASTTAEQQFAVTCRAGELVMVNRMAAPAGLDIVGARVVSNNVLGITFGNPTAAVITPAAAQTYTVWSAGGLDAINNDVVFQVTAGTAATVATVSSAAITLAVSNGAVTDIVTGVQKPTHQAGLVTGQGFVSAAGVFAAAVLNTTAANLTPTANEVWAVRAWRPNPVAPLKLYTQTLTPVATAPNTSAEQGFTVTGLIATTPVFVNPQAALAAGIGISGVRVSATDTLGINFTNFTSASITQPAFSAIIGNFQMPVDAAGNSILQSASLAEQQSAAQVAAMRTSMVALGLWAGA